MGKRLKRCPFCGGKAEIEPEGITVCGYWVKCSECGIEQRIPSLTPEKAADVWNKRKILRPQGKWLQYDEEDANTWECSICHEVWQLMDGTPAQNNMKYCHNCGAEMTSDEMEATHASQQG